MPLITVLRFIWCHPLNAGRRVSAVVDFLRWQIGTRLLGMKVIVPWVDEAVLVAGRGETGLTGNLYAGFTEYQDMVFLLHVLRERERLIDVGANVGAYTILASTVVGAHVVAFEPIAATVERLRDQVNINRVQDRVVINTMGVGSAQGVLRFTNDGDTVNKVALDGEGRHTTEVRVTTLDAQVDLDTSFVLKVDVEGFEYDVLRGAGALLASDRLIAVIIELNGSGEAFGHTNEEIHRELTRFGLQPVLYDPVTRMVDRLDSFNAGSGNTIYVRDVSAVAARCAAAPKRVVHTAGNRRI